MSTGTPEIYTYLHTLSRHDARPSCAERELLEVGRQPRDRPGGDRMRRDAAAVEQHQGVARTDAAQVDRSGGAAGVVGAGRGLAVVEPGRLRSEEHTSELLSLMRD